MKWLSTHVGTFLHLKGLVFFNVIYLFILEKAIAPHSSTLAWKILWTGQPGGLPSMGSHRVGHD